MYIDREKISDKIHQQIKINPIVILIGARQVGKTTLLRNLHFDKPVVYLVGQDPDTAEIFQKVSAAENYLRINLPPGDKDQELNGFLLIDEFQYIKDISTSLKLLTDLHPGLKVICSGSSSLDIIQQVEESLAGRVHIIDIFSLSFGEYLKFQNEDIYNLFNAYNESTEDEIINPGIKIHFNDYLIYGGMPRSALTKGPNQKIQLLDDIYKTYLLHDVRSYVRNEDSIGFNKLLIMLASQIGNLINVSELSNSSGLSYRRCEDYIYLLEQMFIIKLIEPFYTNKRKVIGKMKKVYFTDAGLRNIIIGNFSPVENRTDSGALFENFVYLELIRKMPSYAKIYFYRTKDGAEVDFIIDDLKNKYAVEAKYKTLKKPINLKSLSSFKSAADVKKSYIINLNYNSLSGSVHIAAGALRNEDNKFLQGCLVEKIELN